MELAIRIDVSKSEAVSLIDKINNYLKPADYLYTFEISKVAKKEHIHGFLEVDDSKNLETIRKWISRQKWYKGKGSTSLVSVKDTDKYLDYISKDMNIIKTNMDEDRIDHLIERALSINLDKKQSLISKLFHNVTGYYIGDYEEGTVMELEDTFVLKRCIEYFKVNKLLHPNRTQMFQYVQTILSITGNDVSVFADYYSIFSTK